VEENHQIPLQVVFAGSDMQPRNATNSTIEEFPVNDYDTVDIVYQLLVVYLTILTVSVF
jgi:hypothetical protein